VTASLILPPALRRAIEAAAEAAYPQEFCALLLGRALCGKAAAWRVEDWRPAANVHPQPERHFELDPAVHFATLRALRDDASGLCLLGHVHSHPDAEAVPSATDLSMAFDPDMVWLILSVRHGKAGELTAWTPPTADKPATFAKILLKTENS
jgi:proteasome lid subunit RPN8/RPN11